MPRARCPGRAGLRRPQTIPFKRMLLTRAWCSWGCSLFRAATVFVRTATSPLSQSDSSKPLASSRMLPASLQAPSRPCCPGIPGRWSCAWWTLVGVDHLAAVGAKEVMLRVALRALATKLIDLDVSQCRAAAGAVNVVIVHGRGGRHGFGHHRVAPLLAVSLGPKLTRPSEYILRYS